MAWADDNATIGQGPWPRRWSPADFERHARVRRVVADITELAGWSPLKRDEDRNVLTRFESRLRWSRGRGPMVVVPGPSVAFAVPQDGLEPTLRRTLLDALLPTSRSVAFDVYHESFAFTPAELMLDPRLRPWPIAVDPHVTAEPVTFSDLEFTNGVFANGSTGHLIAFGDRASAKFADAMPGLICSLAEATRDGWSKASGENPDASIE